MKNPIRRAAALWCVVLLCVQPFAAGASYTGEELHAAATGIVMWKKQAVGADGDLLSALCQSAGSSAADWYAMAIGRMGTETGEEYLAALRRYVEERYRTADRLDAKRATEWHRIALTVLALGGDPTAFGTGADGAPINLIADGTYDRARTAPLGAQGVNGYIWALLALDAGHFDVPAGAADTRADMIAAIGEKQLESGGVTLDGKAASVDLTAMTVTALAPYYADTAYPSARVAIDRALGYLAARQNAEGDFSSFGQPNAESTAQVLIALCALGIDPTTDERFIKEGHTVTDGLMTYRRANGGFAHIRSGDANSMAGEQTLCALNALERFRAGERAFYDMTGKRAAPPTPSSTTAEPLPPPSTVTESTTHATSPTVTEATDAQRTTEATAEATTPSSEPSMTARTTTLPTTAADDAPSKKRSVFLWIGMGGVGAAAAAVAAVIVYRRRAGKEQSE